MIHEFFKNVHLHSSNKKTIVIIVNHNHNIVIGDWCTVVTGDVRLKGVSAEQLSISCNALMIRSTSFKDKEKSHRNAHQYAIVLI